MHVALTNPLQVVLSAACPVAHVAPAGVTALGQRDAPFDATGDGHPAAKQHMGRSPKQELSSKTHLVNWEHAQPNTQSDCRACNHAHNNLGN